MVESLQKCGRVAVKWGLRSETLLRVERGGLLASVLEEVGVRSEEHVAGHWYSYRETVLLLFLLIL